MRFITKWILLEEAFFWDSRQKKKYRMVKWEELEKQRDQGGLGFTDTRLMIECLLAKWIITLEGGVMIYAVNI
jgi:hypothetical protein